MSSTTDPTNRARDDAATPRPGGAPTVVLLGREPTRVAELASALERAGIVALATETTLAGAATAISKLTPSVAVLDTGLRDDATTPTGAIASLRREQPELKIVCLHDPEDRQHLAPVFAAGADAVFLRRSSPAELAQAVCRLLRDDVVFVPVAGCIPDAGSEPGSTSLADLRRTLATRRRPARPAVPDLPGCSPA